MGRDANGDLFYGHNPDSNDPVVVRCSTDDGSTWNPCDSGLPSSQVGQEFVVNAADGKLYALIWNEVGHTGAVYRTVSAVQ